MVKTLVRKCQNARSKSTYLLCEEGNWWIIPKCRVIISLVPCMVEEVLFSTRTEGTVNFDGKLVHGDGKAELPWVVREVRGNK